jgi:3'-phosphoadenosine 5'-phosphosulfate sulfotransferase (PAPS reductase)/FAD synthetase
MFNLKLKSHGKKIKFNAESHKFEHTAIVLRYVSQRTDSIILLYSGGKDSIVLLHILCKYFKRVHCVFMYFVKDLEHQQPLLNAVKNYENATLEQVPHFTLSEYFQNGVGRFHETNRNITQIGQRDIENYVKNKTGIQWAAYGLKEKDSIKRRMMLRSFTFDAINEKSMQVHPLAKWSNKECLAYIAQNKLIKPVQYNSGVRSDGVDIHGSTLYFLKHHFPNDLQKLIKVFPLAELNLIKYEEELRTKQLSQTSKVCSRNNKQEPNKKCTLQPKED